MKKTHNFCTAAAVILLLACGVTACGEAAKQPDETKERENNTEEGTETEAVTEESGAAYINVPDDLEPADLDGYEFRIWANTDEHIDSIYSDGLKGSIVSDAVYGKLSTVEERFNCKILLSDLCASLDDSLGGQTAKVRNNILSGDDLFDVVFGHDMMMGNLSLEKLFINLYEVPHLNFDKPWWQKYIVESLSVGEIMPLLSNHFSYYVMAKTRAMYFNKDMMRDLDYDSPYQMVFDHTWTLDKMTEMVKDTYNDLNGSGQQDEADRFGYLASNYMGCYLECFVEDAYHHDADGEMEFLFDVGKYDTIATKICDLVKSQGSLVVEDEEQCQIFCQNRMLFTYARLSNAVYDFSNSNLNYGILPMPLLDETQTEYRGACTDRPGGIPVTADGHLEQTGLIIEAVSAEGYRRVYPAYFEIAMKTRYADQSEDAQMLDIIMKNDVISFSYIYGNFSSPANNFLDTMLNPGSTGTGNASSYYELWRKSQEKRVGQIQKAFEHMD